MEVLSAKKIYIKKDVTLFLQSKAIGPCLGLSIEISYGKKGMRLF